MFYVIDPLYYLLMAPGLLLAFWAQLRVKSTFAKYQRVRIGSNYSGAEAARRVLDAAGVTGVKIEPVEGWLSDHYDPRTRTLRLSPGVYSSPSVAAVGIAAHEAGHAIQHADGYAPLALRSAMVPVAQFGSSLPWLLLIAGWAFHVTALIWAGVVLFGVATMFTFVTLPVEFDASARARVALTQTGITRCQEEDDGVRRILAAAAWTYVAAAVTALLHFAYFLLRSGVLGRSDD